MKLLVFEWGAYTQPDINACFDQYHIDYRIVSYHFNNKNEDAYDKTDFYLKHPELRKEIAQRGNQKVREQFNYRTQFTTLFQKSGVDF